MLQAPQSFLRRAAGFGLVEIMVGMVIGSLAILVMLQTFSLSEEQKRTATSGGDAQSNGIITFYQIQRDVGQAGYGFSAVELFNCSVRWRLGAAGATSITTAVPLAPVTINPGPSIIPAGDANTDTLLVIYGNTNSEPQGNTVQMQAGTAYTVQMPGAFAIGDRVLAAPCGANWAIDRITATAPSTVTSATGLAAETLYNLGPAPTMLAYAIRRGNLTVCDYAENDCGLDANTDNLSIWTPIASNIVSMRAVYQRDLTPILDGIPETPTRITPGSAADVSGIPANCGWARTAAISLAIVARSSQYEKASVTTGAPAWVRSDVAPIDLSADANWQHYRYKVFQGQVPIRNVSWLGARDSATGQRVVPGC